MKNKKIKIVVFMIIFSILSFITINSLINIMSWKSDNDKIKKQLKEIVEKTSIKEIDDNNEQILNKPPEVINTDDESINEINQPNPYWDYIKIKMIDVDFNELKNLNQEVKGWIMVNGTNINYPFVQSINNEYYLTHSFDKKYNKAGWVFLDYRNDIKSLDKNTVIYAHGRIDNTMFGSLKKSLGTAWYNDLNNHFIKLSTETENTLWHIFSVYYIETTSDYIQTDFSDDTTFSSFLIKMKNRSLHNFNIDVSKDDKVLTLSTCYNQSEKVVMHAKLIKKSSK
jgi:sortase, SrtB family